MMRLAESAYRAQVRKYKSFETPLTAQHFVEQPWICGAGHAVNVVVSGHDAHGRSLPDGWFKRLEHDRAKLPFADMNGSGIQPAFRAAMRREVFGFCNDGVIRSE